MNGSSAFVLSRTERRESDWLTTLYTEKFGLIRALAPGIRKNGAKLRGHLEPLTKTEVMIVEGKHGYRLTGAVLIDAFPKLVASLEKRAVVEKAAAVVARIFFEERDANIWKAMNQFFTVFNKDENLPAAALAGGLYWFLTRVLTELGYTPSHDSLFSKTPRLKLLFNAYEAGPVESALGRDYSHDASQNIGRALQKAFQIHTGHDFSFICEFGS